MGCNASKIAFCAPEKRHEEVAVASLNPPTDNPLAAAETSCASSGSLEAAHDAAFMGELDDAAAERHFERTVWNRCSVATSRTSSSLSGGPPWPLASALHPGSRFGRRGKRVHFSDDITIVAPAMAATPPTSERPFTGAAQDAHAATCRTAFPRCRRMKSND
jgi:hypothetical protein